MRRFTVHPAAFERHCRLFAASGRTPMTVSALAEGLRSAQLPPDPIVVTFDGGFDDTLDAASRLADAGLPSTAFVTTSGLGRPGMLTEADLGRLAARGVEIGGHGHTHRRLDELGEQELDVELTVCRRSLAAAVGTEITAFSYPFGSHDRRTRQAVAAAGYRCACGVRPAAAASAPQPAGDLFALARLRVTADLPDDRLAAWLDGRGRRPGLPNRMWRQIRRTHAGARPVAGCRTETGCRTEDAPAVAGAAGAGSSSAGATGGAAGSLRTGRSSRPGAWSVGAGCRPAGSSHSWTA
jgi:peptidoglycan/xylan/chitin deacetylase (PgdA/CDA1 family)